MKLIITLLITVILIFTLPPVWGRPEPPPTGAAACVVVVIGVTCVTITIYGLWRMCQAIPAPGQDPPAQAPISEIPGIGPPSYMHPLPPLRLRNQALSARVSLQHQDRGGWQTDYTFVATPSAIGGFAMIAYDSNGVALMTNDVPITSLNGENLAGFNFSNLPQVTTNSPDSRMFRLIGQ